MREEVKVGEQGGQEMVKEQVEPKDEEWDEAQKQLRGRAGRKGMKRREKWDEEVKKQKELLEEEGGAGRISEGGEDGK